MRKVGYKIVSLGVIGMAVSGDSGFASEGHELLKKSAAALANVKEVSYRGTFKGTGWVEALVPKINGSVVMGQPSKWDEPRFVAKAKVTPRGATEEIEVTAGSNGDEYFLVDTKAKKVHVDMDSAVLGSGARSIQRLIFDVLVSKDPFGDDLASKTIDLRDTESVGGVDCRKVFIDGEGVPGDPMVLWFIGIKDSIPRGIRRIYKHREDPENGEKGVTELMITDLKINPSLGKAPFDPTIPPGFTKTDEFAP